MANVFVLQHVHTREDGVEDIKFIGVYSSRENACAAVVRLILRLGFTETPDGFHIDEYPVDQDHWVEGFVTPRKPNNFLFTKLIKLIHNLVRSRAIGRASLETMQKTRVFGGFVRHILLREAQYESTMDIAT